MPNSNGNIIQSTTNGKSKNTMNDAQKRQKEKEREERESIVLWKKPLLTLEYFIRECGELVTYYGNK